MRYRNHFDLDDSFMVESGYMRRMPILQGDSVGMFKHVGTGEQFLTKTPNAEELYANKWCTFLYRGSSRDLFDVYMISKMSINPEAFRKCAVVDSLMRGPPKLHEIDVEEIVQSIPIDTGLRNLLPTRATRLDFNTVKRQAAGFSKKMLRELTPDKRDAINKFYDEHSFEPDLLDIDKILNENISNHPMIRRALETL